MLFHDKKTAFMAPHNRSYIFWGKLFFGDWPSYSNIFGMFLIAFSGILIAFREQIKTKNQPEK